MLTAATTEVSIGCPISFLF